MRRKNLINIIFVVLFVLVSSQTFLTLDCLAAGCDCVDDAADPPFLAAGADANVVIIVDNSASMYDMAYIDVDSTCFDDNYDDAAEYAGYFNNSKWYLYDPADSRFEEAADGICGGGSDTYSNSYTCISTLTAGAPSVTTVVSFKAKGNYLNWATASKFDIKKKILTGGKYDAGSGILESEGCGCAGNSFIKQVNVQDTSNNNYKLVLSIHTDQDKTDNIDTTLIDILPVTVDGFVPAKCQEAIDLMMGPSTGFGSVKGAIYDCMDYSNTPGTHDKQALIESLHDCWYLDKQGSWPGGGAQGFNFEKWCSEKYADPNIDPQTILPSDPAYICFGNGATNDQLEGYIGECWNPGSTDCGFVICDDAAAAAAGLPDTDFDRAAGYKEQCNASGQIEFCTDWNSGKDECKRETDWVVVTDCEAGVEVAGWKTDAQVQAIDADGDGFSDYADLDECITDARERFCGVLKVPEVVDPSDLTMSTGETWNLPAMLTEQGAYAQVGQPLDTYKGKIQADDPSDEGLLYIYKNKMNIGVMAFNPEGSAAECGMPDSWVAYDCDLPDNKDGSKLIVEMGQDSVTPGHFNLLKNGINDIKAETWTPLAEAMFNAIGYYTQKDEFRINTSDFIINDPNKYPIKNWCEKNNVLIITDGGSTADLNPKMTAQATSALVKDPDYADDIAGCDDLFGSSFLDDLTSFAKEGDIFDSSPYADSDKNQKILTFIVAAGTPRQEGTGECSPLTLLNNAAANGGTTEALIANSMSDLYQKINEALKEISKRASSGSAASVIAATRSGEGAVYQAIFWPSLDGPAINTYTTWAGEVHSVLVDSKGYLYEDTNGDHKLTYSGGYITDKRVVFYYDELAGDTKACYGPLNINGTCDGTSVSLHEVKYLWSAAEWLSSITDDDIDSNRSTYISEERKRYIFTWSDLDNDGAVDPGAGLDSGEMLSFVSSKDWSAVPVTGRSTVQSDFNVGSDAQMDSLVDWIRGKDDLANPLLRARQVPRPSNFDIAGDPTNITWRLGDIVHSTPTSVGKPVENYHMLYKDGSYGEFVTKYMHRRHMIYFGSNDGMLHAVNGGFYSDGGHQFVTKLDASNNPVIGAVDVPDLGAELWAYIPYNLAPHLHCLTEPDYLHKYFVDQKPRVFDVKIFPNDTDHPNGWGTILVAGMRLGGSEVDADDTTGRTFTSAYAIFDITNPEVPPVLLGELTYDPVNSVKMGYTIGIPSVVPLKQGNTMKWYLVIGSGPTTIDATSDQNAKIGVFPLEELITGTKIFRLSKNEPTVASNNGSYDLTSSPNGFVSDLITVDFQLDSEYRADAIYFGTVEGTWGDWTGKLYRWATLADNGITQPYEWSKPAVMFNPDRPITAATSVGYDGFNYWLYFGTGRFFHKDDKTDSSSSAQDYFYGLKETIDHDGNFVWTNSDSDFWWDNAIQNVDDITAGKADPSKPPGSRNLLRVDQILVANSLSAHADNLSCLSGTCLPAGVTSYDDLVNYIVEGFNYDENNVWTGEYTGTDGWYLQFDYESERNLGQATLLGGIVTFTTYLPYDDICQPEGESYLYAPYYQTGTAWYSSVFNTDIGLTTGQDPVVLKRINIGRGLATTPNLHVGKEKGAKAFVQTSTGAIIEIDQPNLPLKESKSGRVSWRCD